LNLDDFMKLSLAHTWAAAQSTLGALGSLIHSRFRAEDIRGRLGEDTLAVAFPNETMETVTEAVSLLLDEFAEIKLPSPNTGTFKTTFSAGLAEYPYDGDTAEALLNAANQRLLAFRLASRGVIAH
jgi:diguanylate cyclase (GGDEF)-like protein